MHPELQSLVARYESLVDAVDAGSMTLDQAMHTLSALVVVDGAGGQWSLTADGQFQRAQPPGPPVPADPAAFVAPTLAPPPSGMPGWDPPPASTPSWDTPPSWESQSAPPPAQLSPAGGFLPSAGEPSPGSSRRPKIDMQWILEHRTMIVVAAAVLLGGFLVLRSMSSSSDVPEIPSALPSASQAAGEDLPELPSEPSSPPLPEDSETPEPPNLPGNTGEAMARALASGAAQDVLVFATPATSDALLLLAAQVRGAESAGLKVKIVASPSTVTLGFSHEGERVSLVELSIDKQGKVAKVDR